MRITIVLGAFLPVPPIMGGAVEKVWLALAQEFVRRGHEVTMISRAMKGLLPNETRDGIHHLRIKGYDTPASLLVLKLFDFFYSLRVSPVLPQADLVVTNTFWLPIFLRTTSRGKLYVHVARFPKGQMRLYQHAARLQTPSYAVAQKIRKEVPAMQERIRVIPNPLPRLPSARTSSPEKVILYVGRLHPEKGVHLLLEAFHSLGQTGAGWRLVLVGPWETQLGGGGEEYNRRLRADSTDVEFRGAVFDEEALAREYQRARLFVYPSLAESGESFGLAPLEALAHGCAVLVSDLGCFRDFLHEDETGFVFNHRAASPVEALREKICGLIANEDLLARVAKAGFEESKNYAPASVADEFLKDFASVIADV